MFSSSFQTTFILLENSSEFLISFPRTAPLPGVDCVLWTLFSRCPIPRCLDRRIHSPYLSTPPLLAEVFFFQGFVLFSCQSSNIHTLENENSCIRRYAIQSDRQITSNFLKQAGRRLYEIRQPRTSLCTTSNFLI